MLVAAADRLRHRPGTVEASPAVLAKVAFGDRSDGIVAIVETPAIGLADLPLRDDPLVVVVEGVEKPGNLGAVLRTADGAGRRRGHRRRPADRPVQPERDPGQSLGTIFTSRWSSRRRRADVAAGCPDRGIRVVAASVGAPRLLHRRGPHGAARDRPRQRGRGARADLGGRTPSTGVRFRCPASPTA